MANRTFHVSMGMLLAAIYIPIDIIVINDNLNATYLWQTWMVWIIAFLLAIIGSEGPDFDVLYSFMSHRDIVSHSAIYPGLLFAVGFWWKFTINHALVSAFIPFMIGYSSHLFLDYFPNIDMRKLRDGKLRIKEKKGTFLMHVPFIYKNREGKIRRTLDVKGTERWLLTNSFLCFAMAMLLAFARYYTNLPPMVF